MSNVNSALDGFKMACLFFGRNNRNSRNKCYKCYKCYGCYAHPYNPTMSP